MLNNWRLAYPINSKGQSSYSGSTVYIDSWEGTNSNTSATVNTNGYFQVNSASGALGFVRQIIDGNLLKGQTVTLSVLKYDGTLNAVTVTIPSSVPATNTIVAEIINTADILYATDGDIWVRLKTSTGGSTQFSAIKLEIGDTQTLVHKVGNVWVLNDAFNPVYNELYNAITSRMGGGVLNGGGVFTVSRISGVVMIVVSRNSSSISSSVWLCDQWGGINNISENKGIVTIDYDSTTRNFVVTSQVSAYLNYGFIKFYY